MNDELQQITRYYNAEKFMVREQTYSEFVAMRVAPNLAHISSRNNGRAPRSTHEGPPDNETH